MFGLPIWTGKLHMYKQLRIWWMRVGGTKEGEGVRLQVACANPKQSFL